MIVLRPSPNWDAKELHWLVTEATTYVTSPAIAPMVVSSARKVAGYRGMILAKRLTIGWRIEVNTSAINRPMKTGITCEVA